MADIIDEAVTTVDNKLDALVGVQPAGAVKRVVDKVVPANAIHGMTGIPKPHSMLNDVQNKIESDVSRIIR